MKNLFLPPALLVGLGLILVDRLAAQTFTTLHSLNFRSDGSAPAAGLILSGNTLYGTATGGGSSGYGTIFAVNTDGTGFNNLYNFTNGIDGQSPQCVLAFSGDTLYGTQPDGGSNGWGTVFSVNTDGSNFTNVHTFSATSDGVNPVAGVILSGSTLYGTAEVGGSTSKGTVFKVNTDGTGFLNLHNFSGLGSDGAFPYAGVVLSGDTLYGTAYFGGSSGAGMVYSVTTNGTGFTNLHSFTALNNATNGDGAYPYGGLLLAGGTLYGTAAQGGGLGGGTIFRLDTDGSNFTNLYNFATTNSDGAKPDADLILSANTLYGTASGGGGSGNGTIFQVGTDGSGFKILHDFSALAISALYAYTNSDGAGAEAGLILSGNALYGTAYSGGTNGFGTVFSLSLGSAPPPQPTLSITPSGENVVLAWPAGATGFILQSTTSLISPGDWSTVSPAPVVVNGQFTVTNSIPGAQQFYRLSQ